MNKKKGFTLIELLAAIVILSVLLAIIIYAVTRVINTSKSKSYKVTVTNIEGVANNYLSESTNRLVFILTEDKKAEYQCLTVQNLIDLGYLEDDVTKSKISNSKNVERGHYIYVEREIESKSVTKELYLEYYEGNDYNIYRNRCNDYKAFGNITFNSEPSLDIWSKEKVVDINYILKNYNYPGQFSYGYTYSNDGITLLKDDGNHKTVKVVKDGTLLASIKNDSGILATASIDTKIDREAPVADMNVTNKDNHDVLLLTCTDDKSGVVKYYFGTTNTADDSLFNIVASTKEMKVDKYGISTGTYYLICKDAATNVSNVKSITINEVIPNPEDYYEVTLDANGGTFTGGSNGWELVK